jgi:predicted outer membrane protein
MKKTIMLLVTIGALNLPVASAQINKPTMADSTTVTFVSKAIRGGRMEVAMGKLAASKGQRADVKAFAQEW